MYISKSLLTDGEACLLVAIFEHLKKYEKRAQANGTSVAIEINNSSEFNAYTYKDVLVDVIANLNNHERKIIGKLYGLLSCKRLSREEVAREFNVTRERIRQFEAKTLQKMKRYLTELTDEEEQTIIPLLDIAKIEQLVQANRAEEQGNIEAMGNYMNNYLICRGAIGKLRIRQDMKEKSAQ